MLLLKRGEGDAIVLMDQEGEHIATILVTKKRGKILLGIDAEQGIRVVRAELLDMIPEAAE